MKHKRKSVACRTFWAALFAVLAYVEFFSYIFSPLWWGSLPAHDSSIQNQLRLLLVADPQLIGTQNEKELQGPISRWDSDRYVARTFQTALSYVEPDLVVFLGDILDEGSISTDIEFHDYVDRFNTIFSVPKTVKTVILPGDNDVGGEGFDRKTPMKVSRFNSLLLKNYDSPDVTTVSFISFLKTDVGSIDGVMASKRRHLSSLVHLSGGNIRVVLNHETLMLRTWNDARALSLNYAEEITPRHRRDYHYLRNKSPSKLNVVLNHLELFARPKSLVCPIIDLTRASIAFSAHSHLSKIYTCFNCFPGSGDSDEKMRVQARYPEDYEVHHLHARPVNTSSGEISEIVVPTCSYRMGVPNMGYGAAVIDSGGNVQYTVLWHPTRYPQLYFYAVVASTLSAFFMLFCLYRVLCFCIRRKVHFKVANV